MGLDPRQDVMTDPTSPAAAQSRRGYTLTAHITVDADADLRDPFTRAAMFTAVVEQLRATPLLLDTEHGAATAYIGIVTAVS
jgi:hypothetical protein